MFLVKTKRLQYPNFVAYPRSAHDSGRNEGKNIWVEIQDRGVCTSSLTRKVAEVDVKRIAFPSKSKLYIHLGNPRSVQVDCGTHSIRMRGETSQSICIRDVVHRPSRELQSGVDMSRSNEFQFAGDQAVISKYGERVVVW